METQPADFSNQSLSSPTPGKSNSLLIVGIFMMVLVLVSYVGVSILGSTRLAQKKEYDDKIIELNKQLKESQLVATQKEYNALDTVTKQMKQVRDERFVFGPVWDDIKASVPKEVQFLSVTMASDATVRITGLAKSVSSVSAFAKALSSTLSIPTVTPLSIDRSVSNDTFNFTLSFKLPEIKKASGGTQ